MAKDNRAMVSFNLPIELITEILSRLPVKSLLRFKSICKAWYALINNPNFNEIRHKTNPQISSILVATNRYLYFSSEGIYNPIDFDSLEYKLLGICNGLVFVSFSILQHGFIIGNPTTGEFRQVSSPRLRHNGFFLYGFGLFSDEYKFVRVRLSSGYYLAGKAFVKAEVYTMSTDIWVEVDVKVADRVGNFNYLDISIKLPVFLNVVFYWALWNNNQARVVSIDVSDEFYDEIDIPVSLVTLPNDNEDYWRLMMFEEKLSLIIYKGKAEFDLRVLDENKSHWTLKLRIDDIPTVQGPLLNLDGNSLMVRGPLQNSSDRISVVSYAVNGKILVEDAYAKYLKLILYDLNTRDIKTLPRIDVQGANKNYFYTEFLRSVKLGYAISEAV